jgi:SAM-dependent methyltransferase
MERGDDYAGCDLDRQRTFTRLFWVPQYRRAMALIKRFKTRGRLLDVGCGTGEFLDVARESGFAAFGIEPSETAGRVARQRHAVFHGELGDVNLEAGAYDIVTFWSVLEHIPDPVPFLKTIRRALKTDGILALRIPSSSGLLPSLAYWLYRGSGGAIDYPLKVIYQLDWHYQHVFFYDRQNATRLLGQCGFEVVAGQAESSFDVPSLDARMDYVPKDPVRRAGFRAAMAAILFLSRLFGRQDEIVLIAKLPEPG